MEQIKVFISWSGIRSQTMGEALRKYLPRMNMLIKPWMSDKDISAGSMWFQETLKELKEAKFGIICLTSDNLVEPWIHFEAGALLDIVGKQRICPYLLDIKPSDIKDPLSNFQAKNAMKENTREGFDLVSKSSALNCYVNIFNIYSRFWTNTASI